MVNPTNSRVRLTKQTKLSPRKFGENGKVAKREKNAQLAEDREYYASCYVRKRKFGFADIIFSFVLLTAGIILRFSFNLSIPNFAYVFIIMLSTGLLFQGFEFLGEANEAKEELKLIS